MRTTPASPIAKRTRSKNPRITAPLADHRLSRLRILATLTPFQRRRLSELENPAFIATNSVHDLRALYLGLTIPLPPAHALRGLI